MRKVAVINVRYLLIAVVHSFSEPSSRPMISLLWVVVALKMGEVQLCHLLRYALWCRMK